MKQLAALLFIILIASLHAQDAGMNELRRAYQSFEFPKVVLLADRLLIENEEMPDSVRIEIYLMKAVANYSLDQEDEVRSSFIEILKINDRYEIDPAKISPKIINLFEKVKREYTQITSGKPNDREINADTARTIFKPLFDPSKIRTEARIRSVIFPGWGFFHIDQTVKGYIISGIGAALIGSSAYFIVDAINKEKDYQNETDVNLIESKYQAYNDSYKTRNILLLSYAALLIYSQIDLSFIDLQPPENISISPNYNFEQNSFGLNLTVRF